MMKDDLTLIFSEILCHIKDSLSQIQIRESQGYKFLMAHNQIQKFNYSDDYVKATKNVWSILCSKAGQTYEEDKYRNNFPSIVASLLELNVEPNNIKLFDSIMTSAVDNEISLIQKWFDSQTHSFSVRILIASDFKLNQAFDGWSHRTWDPKEKALDGFRSGTEPMTHWHHYTDAFWLEKSFSSLPERNDLITEFSLVRLSLSLSLKERIIINEVKIQSEEWLHCPFLPTYFMSMRGHFEDNKTTRDSTRFFMQNFISRDGRRTFSHERVFDYPLYTKWRSILQNEKLRFSLHHILNGLSDILGSTNYGGYNENLIASDGLTKVFIGLDGTLPPETNRRSNMAEFAHFWQPIFSAIEPTISKRKTKKIYSLRCALLHGDYTDFLIKSQIVYKIICPKAPEGDVSIQHFTFNFSSFIVRTIEHIEANPACLASTPRIEKVEKFQSTLDWIKSRLGL